MRLPWYVTAIGAALVWGIHYPLVEHALRRVSLVTVLILSALPILLATPFFGSAVSADWSSLRALSWSERLPVLAIAVTSVLGAVLLCITIARKNATLASLIEISYPVFVALFTFLWFREVHLSASVLLGAGLVFLGVAIIIVGNP